MPLPSEQVVIQSPMSFVGSGRRIWKLTDQRNRAVRALAVVLAVLLIAVAWIVVAAWTLFFGVFLIPYRLLRRGSRKRKQERLRHREVLNR